MCRAGKPARQFGDGEQPADVGQIFTQSRQKSCKPATDERQAALVVETIKNLVDLTNQFYSAVPIDLSIGIATGLEDERIEEIAKRVDANMYIAKRQHYLTREGDAPLGDDTADWALPNPACCRRPILSDPRPRTRAGRAGPS